MAMAFFRFWRRPLHPTRRAAPVTLPIQGRASQSRSVFGPIQGGEVPALDGQGGATRQAGRQFKQGAPPLHFDHTAASP
jgi:hypothetical protein